MIKSKFYTYLLISFTIVLCLCVDQKDDSTRDISISSSIPTNLPIQNKMEPRRHLQTSKNALFAIHDAPEAGQEYIKGKMAYSKAGTYYWPVMNIRSEGSYFYFKFNIRMFVDSDYIDIIGEEEWIDGYAPSLLHGLQSLENGNMIIFQRNSFYKVSYNFPNAWDLKYEFYGLLLIYDTDVRGTEALIEETAPNEVVILGIEFFSNQVSYALVQEFGDNPVLQFWISSEGHENFRYPSFTTFNENSIIVVGSTVRNISDSSQDIIIIQFANKSNGELISPSLYPMNDGFAWKSDIAVISDSVFVVTWSQANEPYPANSSISCWKRAYSILGPLEDPYQVSYENMTEWPIPTVLALPNGNYVVMWSHCSPCILGVMIFEPGVRDPLYTKYHSEVNPMPNRTLDLMSTIDGGFVLTFEDFEKRGYAVKFTSSGDIEPNFFTGFQTPYKNSAYPNFGNVNLSSSAPGEFFPIDHELFGVRYNLEDFMIYSNGSFVCNLTLPESYENLAIQKYIDNGYIVQTDNEQSSFGSLLRYSHDCILLDELEYNSTNGISLKILSDGKIFTNGSFFDENFHELEFKLQTNSLIPNNFGGFYISNSSMISESLYNPTTLEYEISIISYDNNLNYLSQVKIWANFKEEIMTKMLIIDQDLFVIASILSDFTVSYKILDQSLQTISSSSIGSRVTDFSLDRCQQGFAITYKSKSYDYYMTEFVSVGNDVEYYSLSGVSSEFFSKKKGYSLYYYDAMQYFIVHQKLDSGVDNIFIMTNYLKPQSPESLLKDIYIQSEKKSSVYCTGSIGDLCDSISFAANFSSNHQVTLHLLKNGDHPHYLFLREYDTVSSDFRYDFSENGLIIKDLTIKPLYCDEEIVLDTPHLLNNCSARDEKILVILKDIIPIEVENLILENIILDGRDAISWIDPQIEKSEELNCLINRISCCEDDSEDCKTNIDLLLLNRFTNNHYQFKIQKNLTISNCEFKQIVQPSVDSLFKFNAYSFFSISNSKFDSNFFFKGTILHEDGEFSGQANNITFQNYNPWGLLNSHLRLLNRDEGYFILSSGKMHEFNIKNSVFMNSGPMHRGCGPENNYYLNSHDSSLFDAETNTSSLINLNYIENLIFESNRFENIVGIEGSVLSLYSAQNADIRRNYFISSIGIRSSANILFEKVNYLNFTENYVINSTGCLESYGNIMIQSGSDIWIESNQFIGNWNSEISCITIQYPNNATIKSNNFTYNGNIIMSIWLSRMQNSFFSTRYKISTTDPELNSRQVPVQTFVVNVYDGRQAFFLQNLYDSNFVLGDYYYGGILQAEDLFLASFKEEVFKNYPANLENLEFPFEATPLVRSSAAKLIFDSCIIDNIWNENITDQQIPSFLDYTASNCEIEIINCEFSNLYSNAPIPLIRTYTLSSFAFKNSNIVSSQNIYFFFIESPPSDDGITSFIVKDSLFSDISIEETFYLDIDCSGGRIVYPI